MRVITRNEIFTYVKDQYDTEPEYLWARTPNYAVMRHRKNRKWFAAIVDVTEDKLGLDGDKQVDALLLKCDPAMIGSLRCEAGILPGYHMNKEHWITVLLDGVVPIEKIFALIDLSYILTRN